MNAKKLNSLLDKILNSNEFSESQTSKRLLEYLVNLSLTDEIPKESTIAYEVFGKDTLQSSKSDANVRVYIHNLRKKLDSYYMNEGKTDPIRFTIPKGHYKVLFKENQPLKPPRSTKPWWLAANIVFFIIAIVFIFYSLSNQTFGHPKSKPDIAKHGVWSNLFENQKPVLLVFGDYFLFRDKSSPVGARYIRDFQINSPEDFTLMIPDTNKNYVPTEHTFLGKFALWTLYDLEKLFCSNNKVVELKLASDLNWSDLNKYNVIFVGSFKTQRILASIVNKLNFSYEIHPNKLTYTDEDTTCSYRAAKVKETGYERDYTLVTKLPGPNNNIIYIFSSTHDIGHISTVKYLTDSNKIKKLGKAFQVPENTKYFTAIFEVQGFERTSFAPTLLHFKTIPSDFNILIQPNTDQAGP